MTEPRASTDRAEDLRPGAEAGTEAPRPRMNLQAIETWVDQSIKQAQRRGDFDDLPGAGKPLRNLERTEDPDWWLKGLIEREKLDMSEAMPPALALRRERSSFPQALLDLPDEAAVRTRLEEFNERVLADRKRPYFGTGSPMVVGRVDVAEMVAAWHELRERMPAEPSAQDDERADRQAETLPKGRRRWWRRRPG